MQGDEHIDLILEKHNELGNGQEYLEWVIDDAWWDVTVNEWLIAQGAVEGEDVLIYVPQG